MINPLVLPSSAISSGIARLAPAPVDQIQGPNGSVHRIGANADTPRAVRTLSAPRRSRRRDPSPPHSDKWTQTYCPTSSQNARTCF